MSTSSQTATAAVQTVAQMLNKSRKYNVKGSLVIKFPAYGTSGRFDLKVQWILEGISKWPHLWRSQIDAKATPDGLNGLCIQAGEIREKEVSSSDSRATVWITIDPVQMCMSRQEVYSYEGFLRNLAIYIASRKNIYGIESVRALLDTKAEIFDSKD